MKKNLFVHEKSICESKNIGKGTRIWGFTHILPHAKIGRDCNICEHVFIENDVVIGDRVTIKNGVQLWNGLHIANDVFIGPNVTFANDVFPRSKQYPEKFLNTTILEGASIGANATILPGVTIGQYAMIGAGAVVTKSIPSYAIVIGNPAQIMGYVDAYTKNKKTTRKALALRESGIKKSGVDGVALHRMPEFEDMRGKLIAGEFVKIVPFVPKRYFFVYDVPTTEVRGQHAHKKCHQFLICVKGSLSVVVDDGRVRQEFCLDSVFFGIYIPPMVWAIQYKYSQDANLLVFASHYYDPKDYIRDYAEFRKLRRKWYQKHLKV